MWDNITNFIKAMTTSKKRSINRRLWLMDKKETEATCEEQVSQTAQGLTTSHYLF